MPRRPTTRTRDGSNTAGITDSGATAADSAAKPTLPRARSRSASRGADTRLSAEQNQSRISSSGTSRATGTSVAAQIALARPDQVALSSTMSRYRMRSELGKGGMGVVKLASDPALRREVAIKLLLTPQSDQTRREFLDEAQITGQLEHPNIVPAYELGTDEQGRPFLAMKRVSGTTLQGLLQKRRKQNVRWQEDAAELLDIFGKVCDAVGFAHSRGVIHRDLKPENIMIGEYGEVLVMDWGLAKPLAGEDDEPTGPADTSVGTSRRDDSPEWTMQGEVFGTPSFMPPEQARGEVSRIDERSDIFALGGILYAMLTLMPPYHGRSVDEVLDQAAKRDLLPARRRAPSRAIPKELEAVAEMAMSPERRARYRNASELKADVQAHLTNRPLRARRDPLWTRAAKWAKRHPTTAMTSSVSLIFGLVVLLLAVQLHAAQQAELLAHERAEREAAQREAAHARAEREIAQRAVAEAEARQAREDADAFGRRVLDAIDDRARNAFEEFQSLRKAAHERGDSEFQFGASLSDEQLERYLGGYTAIFEVLARLEADPQREHYYDIALINGFAGNYETAIEYASEAIAADPEYSFSYLVRGVARTQLDNLDGAIADFAKAIELEPRDPVAWDNHGLARRINGDLEGAIDDHSQAIELNPRYANGYFHRGVAKRMFGDLESAIRDFDQTLEVHPRYRDAFNERGRTWVEKGEPEKALADYSAALELDPTYAAVYCNRGNLLLELGEVEKARDDYDRAIAYAPDEAEHYFCRGNLWRKQGEYAKALADYGRALERDAAHLEARVNRGFVRYKQGHFEQAIADFDRAIEFDPHQATAYLNRGAAYDELGDHHSALADYDRVLELAPDLIEVYRNRANTYRALGDAERARAEYDRGLRRGPCPALYLGRGNLRRDTGDLEGALEDFTRAVELEPNSLDAYNNRGNVRRALGDVEGAARDYERVIEIDPDYARVYTNRGNLHFEQERFEEAIADYERAIEADREELNAWINRAVAFVRLERTAEAVDSLQGAYRVAEGDPEQQTKIAQWIRELGGTVPE